MAGNNRQAAEVLHNAVIQAHGALQARTPLVQCITNVVSSNYMANILLAAGASPAMVDNTQEAGLFAGIADALLINLGTPTDSQVESMRLAAAAAQQAGKPWVLDPIGAGGLPWRGAIALELLQYRPAAIRGNPSEIKGLSGLGSGARGMDSSDEPESAVPAALELLRHCRTVGASGAVDHLVGHYEERPTLIRVYGGSCLQPRVTATGCALGALVAAYQAVAEPLVATVAAHASFAIAGKLAAERHAAPGSFAVAFIDELHALDEARIQQHLRIDVTSLVSPP
ncbi:hydroxyethylthiazole kinase [Pseudomonas sp.]|uniref:hydroxyethylthiazole kinase n=1 Tax=Pseudomonas sp. TaxID=306 RepID=UPI0019E1A711|nr:hydroxyethylthiazole kinase [Pseudomonas sp.]MBF0673849.1 hydroxyethylthiazole kinase [Pseudomonas sp.]